jgi:hypothetical protein
MVNYYLTQVGNNYLAYHAGEVDRTYPIYIIFIVPIVDFVMKEMYITLIY